MWTTDKQDPPADTKRKAKRWVLRPLQRQDAIQGFVLTQKLPLAEPTDYVTAIDLLLTFFDPELETLSRQACVQIGNIGRGGSALIRQLGSMLGDYGLGIRPEDEPPRTWVRNDFEKLSLSDTLTPLFFNIMRATARPEALPAVRSAFLGSGAYLETFSPSGQDLFESATNLFKPRITNKSARMFPYHAPILRRSAIEKADLAELESWMCGAVLYVREAVEDDGVLFLYQGQIEPILLRAIHQDKNPELEFLV